jgi:hypothetical protein
LLRDLAQLALQALSFISSTLLYQPGDGLPKFLCSCLLWSLPLWTLSWRPLQLGEFLLDAPNLLLYFAQSRLELAGLWTIRLLGEPALHIAGLFLKLVVPCNKAAHLWTAFGAVSLCIAKLTFDTPNLRADFFQLGLKLRGIWVIGPFGEPALDLLCPLLERTAVFCKLSGAYIRLALLLKPDVLSFALGSGKFAIDVSDLITDCTQPGLKLAGLYISVVRQLFKLALDSAYLAQ